MKSAVSCVKENQKPIARLFDSLCGKYSRWEVWQDFVVMIAIAISNSVDLIHAREREESYRKIAAKYTEAELNTFAQMYVEVTQSYERNPNQDFLGSLYMNLNLGNSHLGQFFTPYDICGVMAAITCGEDLGAQVREREWVSVNDPYCGGGAMLIAYANECLKRKINYQTDVLFVAQDINYIAACMCYIQLSILGCAGYVVVGDTLSAPSTCCDDRGLLPKDHGNVWYTPMFYRDVWRTRRDIAKLKLICGACEGKIQKGA